MRRYRVLPPQSIERIQEPHGGGLYFVTAEPSTTVLYIGRSKHFPSRNYRRHHKRRSWKAACASSEKLCIRFALLHGFGSLQTNDLEEVVIRRTRPPCNDHFTK